MITKYPDGSSYAMVERQLNFTHKINSYEDLWHLGQIVDAYNSYGSTPNITIPCLIDAQADRRFNGGESFGLKLVLDFLGRMNANFTIFHPHNPEIVKFALPNVKIMDNSEYVKSVLYDMGLAYWSKGAKIENTILMSPDAGAFKALMSLCDKITWVGETESASKSREWKDNKSILNQVVARQDFGGKDVIIVDDLCIYGGTFKGLSKLLRERNAGKLTLIVSHMTVQHLGNEPVTKYFDTVYTSNSKYDFYTYTDYEDNTSIISNNDLKIITLF